MRDALQVLWEASDRVCSNRLKALVATLIAALERSGHLELDPLVWCKLLAISAASMDRVLRYIRTGGARQHVKHAPSAATRSVPVRTFADWDHPGPGYMEMDLLAHCGQAVAGSFVHTLTLTDVASGWTECVPLLVREAALVCDSVEVLRSQWPSPLRGLDVDNGTEFVNTILLAYCQEHAIKFTRSCPYHKNDQAWVEQKNGSVVRRLVGYRHLDGVAAADALQQLYRASRLFVDIFQPSFQLKEKVRVGGRIVKHDHPPQTPCVRLLTSTVVSEAVKAQLQAASPQLDPLALLDDIRRAQRQLTLIADRQKPAPATTHPSGLDRFLASLSDAWRDGEVRPTHQAKPKKVRHWHTRKDSFEALGPEYCCGLRTSPTKPAKNCSSSCRMSALT